MGKKLPDSEKKYLLSLNANDITFDTLLDLFADKAKVVNGKVQEIPSRMSPSDEFTLAAGEYFNTEAVKTNAGLFIYNKLVVERGLKEVLGYVNKTINGSVLSEIEDKLANALLNDQINENDMNEYLNRTQWVAMQFHSVLSGSFTMETLKPLPKVVKMRDKLLKDNKDKIEQGDIVTSANIESELLKMAKDELKGNHGLDLYDSGARGSFGNNFKNISVMKGAVFNPTTGRADIVKSNFMEGIRKEDIPIHGNSVVTGAYPKAIGTATSGYFSKQIIAALQAVTLDKKGSDCGTQGVMKVVIGSKQVKDFLLRYIVEGGKLVLLDDSNIQKYIGREVKMRSPMYCVGTKLCRTCAGLMYEKLAIDNIGLTAARVSSTLLNLSMKKFHDSSSKIYKIKTDSIII